MEHFTKDKKCAKYTLNHSAQKLECAWTTENRAFASKLEYRIKKLNKLQKEKLIESNNMEEIFSGKIEISKYNRIQIMYTLSKFANTCNYLCVFYVYILYKGFYIFNQINDA